MLFKAAQNSNPNAPNAKPVVLHAKGYLGLANRAKTSRHFLTRSLYKLCRTWLHRPLFKLTRNDLNFERFRVEFQFRPTGYTS